MVEGHEMKVIAHIRSDFKEKFGIPRQSGLVEALKAEIIFEPAYRDANAVRGLEDFSHIWLIWQFSKANREKWSPTVRPPRMGGNKRMGVFATRSPFRPNSMGLSSVRLEKITYSHTLGPILHVAGADLLDGTPIYDIKPYLPDVDSHQEASGGFTEVYEKAVLEVCIQDQWLAQIAEDKREALIQVLAQDPRPSYQADANKIYGMCFAGIEVKFSVDGNLLTVKSVQKKA